MTAKPRVGVMWAVASAVAYSFSSVVGKDLLGVLGAESLLLWRFGIASVVLWTMLLVWRRRGGPDPFDLPRLRALGIGVLFGLMVYLGFLSLQYLDVSVYIVLVYLYPMLVVMGSSLLGHHRASLPTWLALGVVTLGVVLTVPELFGGVGQISTLGVALALGQAVAMAAFMILSSRVLPRRVDGVVSASWNVLGGALVMAPLAFGNGLVTPTGSRVVGEVLLFALVPTVLANICFFRAMRHIVPGVVAMIMTTEVALAILWSVWFLGESVTTIQVVGATVVMAGVLLAQWVNVREVKEWSSTPPAP